MSIARHDFGAQNAHQNGISFQPITPMATTKSPRFRVKKDNSGCYYWIFYAANNEEVARSSESYVAKRDCLHSIALIKTHGAGAQVFDWTVAADSNGNYPAIAPDVIV